jgi:CheY-like chemotaxis protein
MKVLAVDDDFTILELLNESLALFGYKETAVAPSGKDALEIIAAEKTPFDCILLDIQMPEMDGITLCQKIRTTSGYSRTPIIMLTAMSQREYIERSFAAGATDYVTKPFDFLELGIRLRLAEKLVYERHLVADGRIALEKLRHELDSTLKHKLHEPVEIQGGSRTIGFTAFENYILQLSRGSQFTSSVFAVKVDDIRAIYASTSGTEFRHILNAVARGIADSTEEEDGSLLSYRGNGHFVCVSHGKAKISRGELESMINHYLQRAQVIEGWDKAIRVSVGERASLGSLTRFGALQAVHRAIANTERPTSGKDALFAMSQGRSHTASELGRKPELNRFAFEAILRETLKKEISAIKR